ncbi:MAG: hypothetical protein ABWY12_02765 [Burkholderiales bacterium]
MPPVSCHCGAQPSGGWQARYPALDGKTYAVRTEDDQSLTFLTTADPSDLEVQKGTRTLAQLPAPANPKGGR